MYPAIYIPAVVVWFPVVSVVVVGFTDIMLEYPFASISFILVTTFPSVSIIFVGNIFVVVSPIPNCPYPLYPVAYAVPSSVNIIVCAFPADTFWMFLNILFPSSVFICCGK